MTTNLIRPLKDTAESYEAPIDKDVDGLSASGFYPQTTASNDLVVGVERDLSGNLVLKDGVSGTKTLAQLVGGTGVTESAHKTLRQLIHFIEEGPAEGFASGAYSETLPSASPFPTSQTWYTSSAKTHKIVDETVTYNSNRTIATDQWRIYDTDGSTVLATVTDTVSYSGIFETSRTRSIS
jgi:hypothetical protein